MLTAEMPSHLSELRKLRNEQERLVGLYRLPRLDALEFVRKTLPFASEAPIHGLPTLAERLKLPKDQWWERERVLQQRAEAYFVVKHASLSVGGASIQEEYGQKLVTEEYLSGIAADPDGPGEELVTENHLAGIVSDFWDDIAKERAQFRRALELIIEDKQAAGSKLNDFIASAMEGIVLVPKTTWIDSMARTEMTYCALSVDGICGYALMLLLDERKNLGGALRKCRLEGCGDFFLTFSPSSGGPRYRYCVPEHKKLADKSTASERSSRSRRKRRQKSAAKRSRTRRIKQKN